MKNNVVSSGVAEGERNFGRAHGKKLLSNIRKGVKQRHFFKFLLQIRIWDRKIRSDCEGAEDGRAIKVYISKFF
jgi:hypothetical protein